jgi:DNA modification methylase
VYPKHRYDAAEVKFFFENVDWDFADAWTRHGLSLLHWYPTKLPPQVASWLITGLTAKGEVICDPFCGSGTVLAEAMRLGRRAMGFDVSPIAGLISKARTTLIPLSRLSRGIKTFLERLKFGIDLLNHSILALPASLQEQEALSLVNSERTNPPNPQMAQWFHPTVFRDICFASQCIDLEADEGIRRLLTVVFSSLLRTCSSQLRSWGYIADNVVPRQYIYKDVYAIYTNRLHNVERGMRIFVEQCTSGGMTIPVANALVRVRCADSRQLDFIQANSIDCIVTSPPYGNVSDNVMSQRLSMLWFGHNLEDTKRSEIGARWKRFRQAASEAYVHEMTQCLVECSRILKPGGRLAIVWGTSSKWEKRHPTSETLRSFLSDTLRMEVLATFRRKIASCRQHGSYGVLYEDILIYRKGR